MNDKLHSSRPSTRQTKTDKKINTVVQERRIIDVWRDFYPADRDYTHYSHPHSMYTLIDNFLIHNTKRQGIVGGDIETIDISDHRPLYLTISLN